MPLELKNINGNGGFTLVNTSNGGGLSLVVTGSISSPSFAPPPTPTSTAIPPSITPTISVTPSITPTISVTPSITPTISLTPSITPSTNSQYKRVYPVNGVNSYGTDGTTYCGNTTVATQIGGAGGQYEFYFVGNGILPALGDLTYKKLVGSSTYELEWPSSGNWQYISSTLGAKAEISVNVTSLYGIPVNGYGGARVNDITICPPASPTPTPTKSPSISVTPSVTRTPSITPTRTPSVTRTPSITPTISVTPSVTATLQPTPSITPSQGVTVILITAFEGTSSSAACTINNNNAPFAWMRVATASENTFIVGKQWYANSGLTTPYPAGYYADLSSTSSNYQKWVRIDSNGIVAEVGSCLSPTPTISTTPTISVTPTKTPTVSVTPTISTTPTISVTPSITPSIASGIVTSGLVFNLQTAPSSGTTWTDASGNGRNATLQGTPSYTGSFGGGIKLNNATYTGTDYISVPYNISSSTVTVEIVASFNSTTHWATIWGNESYSAGRGYLAFMTSATNLIYGKSTAPTTETITASNSVRHWTFVINGTQHSLYLNGTQVGTTDTLAVQTLFATSEFLFGARHTNAGTGATDKMNNSNSALQPVFYQMRVYNRALSGSEVTQNFNAIRSTYGL